jgi:transcriptional regulator with XRE-family HTH domain
MSDQNSSPQIRWYLREWRKAKGLKQHHIAEAMGTSNSVVSEQETGKRRMNDDGILGWAAALGVEPVDLFRHPNETSLASSPMGRRLQELYFALPEEAREKVVGYAEFEAARIKDRS